MSKRTSSVETGMAAIEWDHILEKASLLQHGQNMSLLDPENIMLRACLTGEWNETQLKAMIETLFITCSRSVACIDVDKIVEAIVDIRQHGPGYKRNRIEERCPSASALADLSNWSSNQADLQICCHLPPAMKLHGLHVSLQIEAFGNFLDTMISSEVDLKFRQLASRLVCIASKVYNDEEVLIRAVKPILDELCNDLDVAPPDLMRSIGETDRRRNVMSDRTIHYIRQRDGLVIALASVEFKKGFTGNGNPDIQNIAYFTKFHRTLQLQPAPMLCVSIVGFSHMQVYGACWNDDDLCYDPLSMPLSLLFVPSDPLQTISKVSQMLQAIHHCVEELRAYYDRRVCRHGAYFMYREGFRNAKKLQGKEMCFEAQKDGEHAVIKFTRSYGQAAQDLLFGANLAPIVHSCEPLPGGWQAIVMEKINGSKLDVPITEATKTSLKNAAELLHNAGYVHGDLRAQNILQMDDSTVRILDFDWAEKVGSAKYPCDLNMSSSCGWHEGVAPGGKIEKSHDLFQLESMYQAQSN